MEMTVTNSNIKNTDRKEKKIRNQIKKKKTSKKIDILKVFIKRNLALKKKRSLQ